ILSDGHVDFVQVNKDECYFELRKFLKLLAVANPNALELLYLPNHCILEAAEEFQYLTKIRDTFLTKRCYDTFYHYARTQLRKSQGLNKKRNWEKSRTERKTIHDFCKILIRINGNVFSLKEHIL